jgi:hypothetical protein
MQLICPCCHARYPLDAANQDEAARELLALRGTLPPRCWNPLIGYLGLFRSETRALAWDRALKLAREVMALNADPDRLENALAETVEALRLKGGAPLKNHNYLKRVLENIQGAAAPLAQREVSTQGNQATPGGKRMAALSALAIWAGDDWLRLDISAGLQALVAQSLRSQPAAELITLAADVWYVALRKSLDIEEVDSPRIRRGFERLFLKVTEWPTPKMLLELMPSRAPRMSLPEPKVTDEQFDKGLQMARNLSQNYRNGDSTPD